MADPARRGRLARELCRRVWAPPRDVDAIDELMPADCLMTTAGTTVEGREAFEARVAAMQRTVGVATNEHLEVSANAACDRVVSGWITRGTDDGIFGVPAGGKPVAFTRVAIWHRGRPLGGVLG